MQIASHGSIVSREAVTGARWLTRRNGAWLACALVRLGLGVVFLGSSIPKLQHPYVFLFAVYSYDLVGPQLGTIVAAVLPWLELLLGMTLIAGVYLRGALLGAALLMSVFVTVQISAIVRDLPIKCGCAIAGSSEQVSLFTVVRAAFCLAAAAAGYFFAGRTGHDVRSDDVDARS